MKLKFWHIVAAVLLIVFLLWKFNTCRGERVVPDHSDDKKIVDSVVQIEGVKYARLQDSLAKGDSVLLVSRQIVQALSGDRQILLQEIARLKSNSKTLISRIKGGKIDTAEIVNDCNTLIEDYNNYIIATGAESEKCDSTVTELTKQIGVLEWQKKDLKTFAEDAHQSIKLISGKYDTLYRDYQKFARARSQIFIGANVMANVNAPVYMGLSAMLKTRKNMVYELGAMYGSNSQLYYLGSVKFPIKK